MIEAVGDTVTLQIEAQSLFEQGSIKVIRFERKNSKLDVEIRGSRHTF